MKKPVQLLCLLLCLSLPASAWASYAITLKNGMKLITNAYWRKDGQLMINYAGGILGINLKEIQGIEQSHLTYRENLPSQPPAEEDEPRPVDSGEPPPLAQGEEGAPLGQEEGPPRMIQDPSQSGPEFQEKAQQLRTQTDAAWAAYNALKEQNAPPALQDAALKRAEDLVRQLSEFTTPRMIPQ